MTNDRSASLAGNLENLHNGAKAFKALAIVLIVLGCLLLGAGALKTLRMLNGASWDVAADAFQTASSSLVYFLLAWLARRASDAFDTIAALIGELGEIV